jgi:hypothetical protein
MSTKKITDTFRNKTLKNYKEWNYYVRRDYYSDQCHRHLNQEACGLLNELTEKVEP